MKAGTAAGAPRRRLSRTLIAVAFALAAAIAFGPAVNAPFDFDDMPAVVHNPTIRSLSLSRELFDTPPLGTAVSGRPAVNVSFALNYAANRLLGIEQNPSNPSPRAAIGFRIVNIALHIASALLLLAIIRLTLLRGRVAEELRTRADAIAVIIAGLWLIHPLQTEAVDYVSQRTELLVSLCYLATLYASIRYWLASSAPDSDARHGADRHMRWFVLAVVSSVLGMASKEVMVTAPIVIALYDRAFLSERWSALWLQRARRSIYIALLATTAIALALDLRGGRAATVGVGLGITPFEYLLTQGWALPHYVRLAFWPSGLTYDYGQTPVAGTGATAGLVALVIAFVASIACWRSDRTRWLGFLGLTFFLLLAPSSSVIPIRTEVAAERRMYLALATIIAAVVVAIALLRGWTTRRSEARF